MKVIPEIGSDVQYWRIIIGRVGRPNWMLHLYSTPPLGEVIQESML